MGDCEVNLSTVSLARLQEEIRDMRGETLPAFLIVTVEARRGFKVAPRFAKWKLNEVLKCHRIIAALCFPYYQTLEHAGEYLLGYEYLIQMGLLFTVSTY
eukprot:5723890-Pyramimonas_sp.AAC.1